MFVPGLSLVIPEVSREDPDGCLVIPLYCIPDGCSDMDSLPDGQCLDPGLEAGDMLHDLHAVIARQALHPLVILGGDVMELMELIIFAYIEFYQLLDNKNFYIVFRLINA